MSQENRFSRTRGSSETTGQLAVALLCNQEDIEVGELTSRVADFFLAERQGVPSSSSAPSTPPRASLSAEQLMSKEGLYDHSSSPALLPMVVEEGQLMGSPGVRASSLAIQIPGRAMIALRPVFRDRFAGSLVGVVKFSRGARGAGIPTARTASR